MRAIAKRFGVDQGTVADWRDRGAPTDDDQKLPEWLVDARRHVKARRDFLRPSVVQLYQRAFGHKVIAKMLGVSPRLARTILIEAGIYEPVRLRKYGGLSVNEKGERIRNGVNERQRAIRDIERERNRVRKRTVKVSDLPLFEFVARTKNSARALARYRRKYGNDIEFRIIQVLRRLRKVAKRGRGYSGNNLTWLGCTPVELLTHLESQFELGMTWKNYHKHPVISSTASTGYMDRVFRLEMVVLQAPLPEALAQTR